MDEKFMREALELAKQAAAEGEVPVGAVVVRAGEVVGRGRNRRETARCATAHAEIEAIEDACARLGGWRLWECELYVTLEPCPMCAGACVNARLRRVVYGAADPKMGAMGGVYDLMREKWNHHPEVRGGVLADECAAVLREFFKNLRTKTVDKQE